MSDIHVKTPADSLQHYSGLVEKIACLKARLDELEANETEPTEAEVRAVRAELDQIPAELDQIRAELDQISQQQDRRLEWLTGDPDVALDFFDAVARPWDEWPTVEQAANDPGDAEFLLLNCALALQQGKKVPAYVLRHLGEGLAKILDEGKDFNDTFNIKRVRGSSNERMRDLGLAMEYQMRIDHGENGDAINREFQLRLDLKENSVKKALARGRPSAEETRQLIQAIVADIKDGNKS